MVAIIGGKGAVMTRKSEALCMIGIGVLIIVQVVLDALKIFGLISWPWHYVHAPVLSLCAITIAILAVSAVVFGIEELRREY